ncbi:uncharacterized protein BXZ73DRAFT_86266 [Epithele typhae]|uniref:uncharacterized protein n=1 Tax=Epithele typhae TaxID=378194 RepID=UPI002008DA2C|nr:uncharacterized protein BXZ73DRAFT_86266 [Epithele typhae]KAH9946066.1 hypothetical protein BXZ73DRAFT_86266 [Epithele typhae]
MSSRYDYRRRELERDERDKGGGRHPPPHRGGRRSRSRSPPRRGDRDREPDRKDYYGRDRGDRRDDRRDDRRRDDRDGRRGDRERDRERDRDGRREPPPPPALIWMDKAVSLTCTPVPGTPGPESSLTGARQDSEKPTADGEEEGEEMEATNGDDEAMMAMMGMSGFGSTKGKHVEGNQEGGVDIKKIRTWRQYMNRRGGFNRPLDKIK